MNGNTYDLAKVGPEGVVDQREKIRELRTAMTLYEKAIAGYSESKRANE